MLKVLASLMERNHLEVIIIITIFIITNYELNRTQ